MTATRLEIDQNEFHILNNNGERVFVVEREHLKDGKRGHWLCKMDTIIGHLTVMRDQYSNDIMERAEMHITGAVPFGPWRFRKDCAKNEFLWHNHEWLADLAFQFGGEWTSEYFDWEGRAILIQKVA